MADARLNLCGRCGPPAVNMPPAAFQSDIFQILSDLVKIPSVSANIDENRRCLGYVEALFSGMIHKIVRSTLQVACAIASRFATYALYLHSGPSMYFFGRVIKYPNVTKYIECRVRRD